MHRPQTQRPSTKGLSCSPSYLDSNILYVTAAEFYREWVGCGGVCVDGSEAISMQLVQKTQSKKITVCAFFPRKRMLPYPHRYLRSSFFANDVAGRCRGFDRSLHSK